MIEDKFFSMKYTIFDNFLVGYLEKCIVFFDLNKTLRCDEIYSDFIIETDNLFSDKIMFTNYFKDNFNSFYFRIIEAVCSSKMNTINQENLLQSMNFKITCSCILSSPNFSSIYYIFGTNLGKIVIIDIFYNEKLQVNPIVIIEYHKASINMICLFEEKYLISSSSDGLISFTEISKEKLETSINKLANNVNIQDEPKNNQKNSLEDYEIDKNIKSKVRKSISGVDLTSKIEGEKIDLNSLTEESKKSKLKIISILPIHTIQNLYKLKRISKVVQIDSFEIIFDEKNKKKQKNYLSLDMENNSCIIVNMDNLKVIYHLHLNIMNIIGVYLISYQKCLLFLFENMTLKVINYSTRTIDRIITDISRSNYIIMKYIPF